MIIFPKPTIWKIIPISKTLILAMKLSFLLCFVGMMQVSASVYSQYTKLTFSYKDISIKEVLSDLEDKTDFRFLYNEDFINLNRKVNLEGTDISLDMLLASVLGPSDANFKLLENNLIVIAPKTMMQQQGVTGKVTDSQTGEAMPGVNIVVKGTSVGTTSDASGGYSINVTDRNATLVFSFIGYITQEVPLSGRATLDIALVSEVKGLEEVVVIGYGTRRKGDVTTSISVVNADNLSKSNALGLETAMQGKLTGVYIQGTSGQPFSRPTVRVRGTNTWGIADPLYVIDGVPITEYGSGAEGSAAVVNDLRSPINIMSLINPSDIESVSVLKDASAAAIYGVRAANGVILITTKRGMEGKPTISVSSKFGIQNLPHQYDMLNVQQYVQLYQEAYANNPAETANMPKVFNAADPAYLGNLPTINQQESILNKNATVQDHSIRISGANSSTDYYVSIGLSNTESPYENSWQKRYSLASNINTKVTSFLRAGVNYRFAYTTLKDEAGSLWTAANSPAWQPVYDVNGPGGFAPVMAFSYSSFPTGFTATKLWGDNTQINQLGRANFNDNDYQFLRNLGTSYVELEPIKGLKFRGTLSIDWYYQRRNTWDDIQNNVFHITPQDPVSYGDPADPNDTFGSYGERHTRNFNMVEEFSVTYSKIFGKHSINALFNFMDQKYTWESTGIGASQIPTYTEDFIPIMYSKPEYNQGQNFKDQYGLQGYLGRISYDYAKKYYLDLTLRHDGTSRFHPDNRWGNFPSFSAAWRISSESFMESLTWLTDAKIRGGWGKLGNQETQAFAYLSMVSRTPDYAYGVNTTTPSLPGALGTIYWGASLPSYPNSDLTWESTATTNIGLDAVLLNKIDISFEYYSKLTDGILQASKLPASVGNQNDPVANIAQVSNKGIELSLGYRGKIGPVGFNASGNITTVKNEVLKLYKDTPLGGEQGRIEIGYPIGYLWGFKVGGIFKDQAEVDAYRAGVSDKQAASQSPGDMWFQDVNGPPDETHKFYTEGADNTVDLYDRTYIGKTIPGYFYGINFGFDYKGFDLSVFLQGVGDVQKVNGVLWGGTSMSSLGLNQLTKVLDRWTASNPSTSMPRAVAKDPGANTRFSDRWVEDAGYLRVNHIQLGYTLPRNLFGQTNLFSNARIYFSGTNLATITNWTGLDPENEGFPTPLGLTAGIDITF